MVQGTCRGVSGARPALRGPAGDCGVPRGWKPKAVVSHSRPTPVQPLGTGGGRALDPLPSHLLVTLCPWGTKGAPERASLRVPVAQVRAPRGQPRHRRVAPGSEGLVALSMVVTASGAPGHPCCLPLSLQAKQSLATLTKDVPKRHSLAMPGETVLNGSQEWVVQADLPLTAAIRQSQQTLYHSHPPHPADRQGESCPAPGVASRASRGHRTQWAGQPLFTLRQPRTVQGTGLLAAATEKAKRRASGTAGSRDSGKSRL